jgi:hypothetical protein
LGDNILRIELILLHILLWFLSYVYPPNAKATHRHPTRQWLLVCFTHKQLLKCGSPALSWTAESLQAFTKKRAITHRLLHRLVRCYLRFFLCFITVLHNFPNCLSLRTAIILAMSNRFESTGSTVSQSLFPKPSFS